MPEMLNLVKVPFRINGLMRIAKERRIPLRDLDDGYLAHAVLRELWQEQAPSPFLLRGKRGRIEAWGYSSATADDLEKHASAYGDPGLVAALDGGCEAIVSKPMPSFSKEKRLGFLIRACPVVRLSGGRGGKRGREVDAFLARCWVVGDGVSVAREEVYRDWLCGRLTPERAGASIERVTVDAFQRERFVRRTQTERNGSRRARRIERPDVRLSGELVVQDSARFRETMRHGIGRHKAFGFGMLLVVPPGRSWEVRGDDQGALGKGTC